MTTAVYFDCDGTLLTFDGSYDDLFAEACDRVGIDADPETLSGAYTEEFFRAFKAFDPDPYLEGTRAAFDEHGVDADPEVFVDALLDAEVAGTVVDEGAHDVLDSLDEGTKVGVLTNGVAAVQRRKLKHHDLFERFDAFLPSYEVGSHKPSPDIFAAARERLPADEYVYVGDDIDADVRPARDAGFLAVHLDRAGEPAVAAIDGLGTLSRTVALL